jgi:hypothetical protein
MISSFTVKVTTSVLGVLLLAGALHGPAAADVRDFEFVNLHASAAIVAAWSARAGTRDPWDPIALYTPIEPRSTSRIKVSGGSSCLYDLKVRFDDGYEQTFDHVNLCKVAHIVAD